MAYRFIPDFKPTSEVYKEKIKGKSFSKQRDRQYISDIGFMERAIVQEGLTGMAANMKFNQLIRQYPDVYLALYKELRPAEYPGRAKRLEKEQKREDKELKETGEWFNRQEEEERKTWLSRGGKS